MPWSKEENVECCERVVSGGGLCGSEEGVSRGNVYLTSDCGDLHGRNEREGREAAAQGGGFRTQAQLGHWKTWMIMEYCDKGCLQNIVHGDLSSWKILLTASNPCDATGGLDFVAKMYSGSDHAESYVTREHAALPRHCSSTLPRHCSSTLPRHCSSTVCSALSTLYVFYDVENRPGFEDVCTLLYELTLRKEDSLQDVEILTL
ncbi:hypothetical protein CEUSTIGMA_g11628.t1 [Chlamydomonas eustigma]|uniref:Protein kinase domain-containing protein n=1 Tax=Chlamydomonas eustigma TaxID=1157962 RepID=A0A250XM76_9CHLO|nr:hypothetical protein CEUSTIGMA_g11628.t1 [Chlamydomonas eustigma]|eukprot:GAX84205.1 hypothetical protein CEUSTIGMA_g11628.t1 [Chlamydomonas eustigma]